MELSTIDLLKIAATVLTPTFTLAWHMYKKLEMRIEHSERRITETEKAIISINTEIKFISRDIKEIKDILKAG